MESHTHPAASVAVATAVSEVLDGGDLLIEILLRIGFPTTLVRAALVCKLWLGHISDRAFLGRFRKLHPPRLLGFYIKDMALEDAPPSFVPVLPQPPELAAVISRARFNKLPPQHDVHIHECRNGDVFIHGYDRKGNNFARVHSPLCHQGGRIIPPSLPTCGLHANNYYIVIRQILFQKDGDGMSCFYLHVECTLC
jgi:hypothetical protein